MTELMRTTTTHQWTNLSCNFRGDGAALNRSSSSSATAATPRLSRLEQILLSELVTAITAGDNLALSQAINLISEYPESARTVMSAARKTCADTFGIKVFFKETYNQDHVYSISLNFEPLHRAI